MDRGLPRSRVSRSTNASNSRAVVAVAALLGFSAGLGSIWVTQPAHPIGPAAGPTRASRLLQDAKHAWQAARGSKSASNSAHEGEALRQHAASTQSSVTSTGVACNPAPVAAASSQSSASDCEICEPADPESRFRMRPKAEVAAENPELAKLLQQHAINNEIMLTLANGIMMCKNTTLCWWNGGNILESFITILKHSNITNYLIGVMDDETMAYLKDRGINHFRVNIKVPNVQQGSHPANQVSTIKYTLLKTFLQLGYHTLITDMDLVYVSNPFKHLHRDADIEIQTDGFDDAAYGTLESVHDPSMGWGGGGLYFHTFSTNVGCMWVKANARSFKLMEQVSSHLSTKPGWDQQIFNEYLMRPSHGDFQNAYAHLRVMDYQLWMNSKIFFKSMRQQYIPGSSSMAPTPIMVHFNYHPDKHKRMLCIMDRYLYGKLDACDKFPAGSDTSSTQ